MEIQSIFGILHHIEMRHAAEMEELFVSTACLIKREVLSQMPKRWVQLISNEQSGLSRKFC